MRPIRAAVTAAFTPAFIASSTGPGGRRVDGSAADAGKGRRVGEARSKLGGI
jgi:hypothetical protein